MQVLFILLEIYIGQEYKEIPNIKNVCMYLYTIIEGFQINLKPLLYKSKD
jgi:hypothetical protein